MALWGMNCSIPSRMAFLAMLFSRRQVGELNPVQYVPEAFTKLLLQEEQSSVYLGGQGLVVPAGIGRALTRCILYEELNLIGKVPPGCFPLQALRLPISIGPLDLKANKLLLHPVESVDVFLFPLSRLLAGKTHNQIGE